MITKPKGTYDVLPLEVREWQKLEETIRKICKLYNYKEIRTPIFESSEVFHRDQNDTSDMVTKETYDFKDRSDRGITLRPEGTAGVARAFVENKLYVDNPVTKLFYMGPMFRYERPQKGRNRQFNQFGVEALGSDSPYIDAEVIALGASLIRALGLKDITVKINSLGDEESRSKYKDVLVEHFGKYKDCLCEDCKNRLIKNPLRILDCKVDRDQEFFKTAPKINEYLNEESKTRFNKVLEALDSMDLKYVIDDNLVRGLDYYCHTVFELEVNVAEFGAQNVIGAGGRYNKLISDLGGPLTPGVGMAFGMERLLLATSFSGKNLAKEEYIHAYFIALGEKAQAEAVKVMNACRIGGLSCEMDYLNGSLKSQFKKADKNNARFTIIFGENELAEMKCNIKDNQTDEQETISLLEVYTYILTKLNKASACNTCPSKN
ncbi:histidyl-tRNA synthetase [Anaeroplasma bactoclasticum]|jgi:histidyl-tRNA synthetase|uniref:Histidine--tRNA ligase n=1 Tax=Anaeroplasma bactoclasticum TaxID=2088 RepID=A0A397R3D1_9MOLU|nr:histidine--tRNA ligase [Anaeroplasma bactoclasticum]RIA64921.1 histidyl-tRNA synthetase [Anaeroplasma bactoclasticum]